MKTLTYDEVIALAAAEPGDVSEANSRIVAISPALWNGKPDLEAGWKAGHFKCNTIVIEGVPSYLLWWAKQEPSCLQVLGVAALRGGTENFQAVIEGCESICRENGCDFALFHSVRKGMSRRMLAHGSHIAAVAYRLKVRPLNATSKANSFSQGGHD